jgi:hypothetical protein
MPAVSGLILLTRLIIANDRYALDVVSENRMTYYRTYFQSSNLKYKWMPLGLLLLERDVGLSNNTSL